MSPGGPLRYVSVLVSPSALALVVSEVEGVSESLAKLRYETILVPRIIAQINPAIGFEDMQLAD